MLNALFAPFVVARNGLQVDLGPYPDLKAPPILVICGDVYSPDPGSLAAEGWSGN